MANATLVMNNNGTFESVNGKQEYANNRATC